MPTSASMRITAEAAAMSVRPDIVAAGIASMSELTQTIAVVAAMSVRSHLIHFPHASTERATSPATPASIGAATFAWTGAATQTIAAIVFRSARCPLIHNPHHVSMERATLLATQTSQNVVKGVST